ncbi:MAG: LD-carboxypeptidase [Bacteroidales bacterium]|nr:LD-carboxypeptidase [Bacteroidales bacterium]
MTRPPQLHIGDKVAIVATARKITEQELAPAIELLTGWGLTVDVPDATYAHYHQFAGTDSLRAQTLQHYIDDPDTRAIFCARGGYGTVRIADKINFNNLSQHPKWIIGYSDVTVLHSLVNKMQCCETLHATMPININRQTFESQAVNTLHNILMGNGTATYSFSSDHENRPGDAEGEIVGGNLSILYSLRGTPIDIDTDGKILLIEDLDEYLYHIDRMMQNLRLGGKLNGLKALIVGQMSDLHDNAVPFGQQAYDIIRSAVEDFDYPVCFNAPIGHTGDQNHAIPLGRNIHLSVSSHLASITF